jgi:hypothetical protein
MRVFALFRCFASFLQLTGIQRNWEIGHSKASSATMGTVFVHDGDARARDCGQWIRLNVLNIESALL